MHPKAALQDIRYIGLAMYRLNVKVFLRQSLFDDSPWVELESVFREFLSEWCQELVLFRSKSDVIRIDIDRPGQLGTVIRQAANSRGPTFDKLIEKFGPPEHLRNTGSVELRGSSDSVIIVCQLDEWQFHRLGKIITFGNSISFQICRGRVEGADAEDWATRLFQETVTHFEPYYARACMTEEFDAKNMDTSHGARAIGIDISRQLPGLYWLNYLGREWANHLGERLLTAPAKLLAPYDHGVILRLFDHATKWNATANQECEAHVVSHIGQRFIFSRSIPNPTADSPFEYVQSEISRPKIDAIQVRLE